MNYDPKKEGEKSAQDHMTNYKLNSLFKELINSLVHDQPTDPIPYMVRLLYLLKKIIKIKIKFEYKTKNSVV